MICEVCGADAYYSNEDENLEGVPLCEGCDTPTDACTCEPLDD